MSPLLRRPPRSLWALFSALLWLTFGCGEAPDDVLGEDGQSWQEGVLGEWRPGLTVAQAGGCSTGIVSGLSNQLVAEINCLRPNTLSQYSHSRIRNGGTVTTQLQTAAARALEQVAGARNATLTINSALRTLPSQYLLYRWYKEGRCGIRLAASPGNSNHESGLAVDINDNAAWRATFEARNWRWLGANDPVHFDFRGGGTVSLGGLSVKAFQRLWNRNNPRDLIDEDGLYGPQTEARLRQSPTEGFPIGACPAEPEPPADNVVEIYSRWLTIADQARDFVPIGSSAGIFDFFSYQRVEAAIELRNGAGRPATDNAIVGYEWRGRGLILHSRVVETDAPAYDGQTWRAVAGTEVNTPAAQDNVTLGVLNPKERRRVRFVLEVRQPAVGEPDRLRLRGWVKHIGNYYGEQDGWDDAVEHNDAGRLLRHAGGADVFGRNHWTFNGPDAADTEGFSACEGGNPRVSGGALEVSGCAQAPTWTRVTLDETPYALFEWADAAPALNLRLPSGAALPVPAPNAEGLSALDVSAAASGTLGAFALVGQGKVDALRFVRAEDLPASLVVEEPEEPEEPIDPPEEPIDPPEDDPDAGPPASAVDAGLPPEADRGVGGWPGPDAGEGPGWPEDPWWDEPDGDRPPAPRFDRGPTDWTRLDGGQYGEHDPGLQNQLVGGCQSQSGGAPSAWLWLVALLGLRRRPRRG